MLCSIGIVTPSAHGPLPLTYQEIESWSRVTRIKIEGHEAEMVKSLSELYCSHHKLATNPNCSDPDGSGQDVGKTFSDLLKRLEA